MSGADLAGAAERVHEDDAQGRDDHQDGDQASHVSRGAAGPRNGIVPWLRRASRQGWLPQGVTAVRPASPLP
ncbi:hypothetical protein GCM10009850_042900 [Nonomuraea monospora]|uniref:Uncharacterized protein n=1 Tax=Nonomuraea monospora TaxID=568818 RepID=A0ABP5PAP7_9ACTN